MGGDCASPLRSQTKSLAAKLRPTRSALSRHPVLRSLHPAPARSGEATCISAVPRGGLLWRLTCDRIAGNWVFPFGLLVPVHDGGGGRRVTGSRTPGHASCARTIWTGFLVVTMAGGCERVTPNGLIGGIQSRAVQGSGKPRLSAGLPNCPQRDTASRLRSRRRSAMQPRQCETSITPMRRHPGRYRSQ
jgi:hypothetical protein